MIDLKIILLLITAGVDFTMAVFVLLKNVKDRSNVTFALTLFLAGFWSMSIAFFLSSSTGEINYFWLKAYYIIAAAIAPSFYYFARSYCFPLKRIRLTGLIFHLLALFVIAIMVNAESWLVIKRPWEMISLNPVLYLIYIGYFVASVGLAFRHLLLKRRQVFGYPRLQLQIIIIAFLIAALAGVTFDLFLPLVTYKYIYFGPYFTVIMSMTIYYYLFIKLPKEVN